MNSLIKWRFALLTIGFLDVIALVFTFSKYIRVTDNLNAHAHSLGPLWLGWIQQRNLQHYMFVEGIILILLALLVLTLWNRQIRRLNV